MPMTSAKLIHTVRCVAATLIIPDNLRIPGDHATADPTVHANSGSQAPPNLLLAPPVRLTFVSSAPLSESKRFFLPSSALIFKRAYAYILYRTIGRSEVQATTRLR